MNVVLYCSTNQLKSVPLENLTDVCYCCLMLLVCSVVNSQERLKLL